MSLLLVNQYLIANGSSTAGEIAAALSIPQPSVQMILDANTGGANPMFVFDPDTLRYTVNAGYVSPAMMDADAITALTAAICTPSTCNNDVDVVLAATGVTIDEWQRGVNNTDAILDMLRCGALRVKLQGLGLNLAKLDGMLDSCDKASLVNVAMITHHGVAGV